MAQPLPANHIDATIGDVSGGSQVAVGNYIVQIGRVEGGVVNILNGPPAVPRSRSQPVLLLPRAFPGMLDRETETSSIIQAIQSKESVECSGEPGSGKTSLLRRLAYQPQVSSFSAGVIYFQVNQQSNADLLKSFFDAFYEYDSPVKPTETEIRYYLQNLSGLILLDDVNITPEQIESLMNIAPNCTFIAATTTRTLFGETREVTLKGLPTTEAVNLFQREFGRDLSDDEKKGAQYLCESVDCIPQRVLRAAHQAREENRSLVDIVPEAKSPALDQTLAAAEVKPLTEDEKKVLATLAVFYGAPIAAEHVTAVSGVSGVTDMLNNFESRGLVQSHDNRYTLASDVNNALLGDLMPWLTRALDHFVEWTEGNRGKPEIIAASAQPILLILQWAVAAKRWAEAKRLGHATEEALTLSGKWDMWATALQGILKSAQGLQDRANEAWALHQIGTRALCLGARSAAQASLNGALALREALNDQMGAAVTRHNLNLLLSPPPPNSERDKPSGGGGTVPTPMPLLLKLGLALLGLSLIGASVVWWVTHRTTTTITPPRVMSFSVDPATVPANGQAQLCYEVENAISVTIEPNIGERKPATKECLTVTAEKTTTYTLTAIGPDGKTTTQVVTLTVDVPALARIARFEVSRDNGPGGANDVQFRLCYEVRNAQHAEIDNNGGAVVLDEPHCQRIKPEQVTTYTLSATGSDGRTVSQQVTADATKPPPPPPQVLSFSASPSAIVTGEKAQLCFQLQDASSVQIDSGVPHLEATPQKQCVNVMPIKTTTYTLTALNSEGKTDKKQTTVRVTKPAPQIANFSSQPSLLRDSGSVHLCYEVVNAGSLQIDHGIGAVRPANKGCVDTTLDQTTTFTLTATGEGGMARSQVTIEVTHPPIEVEFTAEPTTITPPNSASLCYRVSQANSISIDNGVGRLRVPAPGQRECVKVQPRETTTYTLTAVGTFNRQGNNHVTVTVNAPARPKHARIIDFNSSETRINSGAAVRLCYETADAQQVSLAPLSRDVPAEKNCIDDSPRRSTTYVLTAVGEDKQPESRRVTVEVSAPTLKHARIIDFNASESKIRIGTSVRLCYTIADAQQASLTPLSRSVPADKNCIDDAPRRSTTYVLTAVGEDRQPDSRRVTVEVGGDQPPLKHARIMEFRASESRVRAGTPVRLCYVIADAERASLAPIRGNVPAEKDCVDDRPQKSTRYVLTAVGEDNRPESQTVTVEVGEDRTASVRITRLEIKRSALHGIQICYAVENAVSANIDPQFGNVKVPGDCKTIRSNKPITFTLTARDASGGSDQRSVDYTPPKPAPIRIIRFWTTTPTIQPGAAARICYMTMGEGTAQISPEPGPVTPSLLKACESVPLRRTTIFTLTVTGPEGQQSSARVTVTVQQPVIN
jgi:hypothetical protein